MSDGKYRPTQNVYIMFCRDPKKPDTGQPFGSAYKSKSHAERTILPYLNHWRVRLGLDPVRRYYENSVFRIVQLNYED